MPASAAVTLTFVSITLGYLTLTQGQTTELDKGTCTYSFVIPQTDLISTCKSYSSQQVENLQKKIDKLQDKVDNLSGKQRNSTRPNQETFSCSCNNSTKFDFAYSDCDDVKVMGDGVSGLYNIDPIKSTGALIEVHNAKNVSKKASTQKYWVVDTWGAVNVYCDLEDEEVGWTILMRRTKMDVSFDRDWYDFKWGFGKKDGGDFWLGLEHMHRITSQLKKRYSLWIVIVDDKKIPHVLPYGDFRIDNEATNYTVITSNYHGQVTDRFSGNKQFTARDQGRSTNNCAREIRGQAAAGGAWWFPSYGRHFYTCGYINLNAPKPYFLNYNNITSVLMKIKPSDK